MSGIIDLTGHADSPPAKVGVPFADMTSGLWIVISALAGLMGRHATGRGCHVDLSMMDVQVSLLGLPAAWWFAEGRKPVRTGTEHLGRVPSAAFECRGGEWLFLSGSDQHWDDICRVLCLDAPEWMARNSARVERRNEVMTMLRAAIILRERSELAEALRAAGVPVGEVNSVPEILSNPHTLARGMIGAYEDAERGQRPALATPCRMSGYDGPNFSPPPRLGAETRTVLSNLLGLSVEEIDELEARGTIA